ncbi:MAG TPA: DUF4179 domain-containing protein [Candidatus Scatomorpha merdigallinarum]|nr:DUF4179 domain-containing protein [Candidatus Scatomorpha merdigallinarum]
MTYYIPDLLDGFTPDIEPDTAPDMAKLREAVSKGLAAGHGEARKRPKRLRRTLLIAVAVAALLSVTAIAAALGGFDWLRETINPPFIDAVEPVEQSVTDQGIELSVIAAGQYGSEAVMYVSLRDTTGAGLITQDAHFWPTIVAGTKVGVGGGPAMFDAESGTAVYQFYVALGEDTDLESSSLTLSATDIYSGAETMDIPMPGFDLAGAVANGTHIGTDAPNEEHPVGELTPGHLADIPGTGHAYVEAVGVINGRLTVQVGQDAGADTSYIFHPYLIKPDGTRLYALSYVSGITPPGSEEDVKEYCFSVDDSELDGWTLGFEVERWRAIRGDWELEVNFGQTWGVFETVTDVSVGETVFEDVSISLTPLRLRMEGVAELEFVEENYLKALEAALITADGEISVGTYGTAPILPTDVNDYYAAKDTLSYFAYWDTQSAIDPSTVTAIRIGDTVIELE